MIRAAFSFHSKFSFSLKITQVVMPLQRRKTKGMPHSLFKSSVGGKESRQHASRCSPISGDSCAVPAGVTLVPNQQRSWQQRRPSWARPVQVSSAGLGSLVCMEERWMWRSSLLSLLRHLENRDRSAVASF